MTIGYLDCFSGISGDMFVGALLDAGLPLEDLESAFEGLPMGGFRVRAGKEGRNHIYGTRFLVEVQEASQPHRTLSDIRALVRSGGLSPAVRDGVLRVFETLACEEAAVHNRPVDAIHFHEVGAVDSILDIVGAVFGIEALGISTLAASALPLGSGFVETQHGRIPVPAPATASLLKGVPTYGSGLAHELVTPTGAALVRTLVTDFGDMPPMRIERLGYGVGTRSLPDRPNLLRLLIGSPETERLQGDRVLLLEANLDDTNPEWLGYLMECLLEAGALDTVFCPVQMKKNRPGVLVQVLAYPHQREELTAILFRESTTLGVRFQTLQRRTLPRSRVELDSPWGKLPAKKVTGPDGRSALVPEYEACKRIAMEGGLPLKEVYGWVIAQNAKDGLSPVTLSRD